MAPDAAEIPTHNRVSKGLPAQFVPPEKRCSLYEDVDYEEYWDDPTQARQDALEKHLIAEMLPPRGQRIIDVGCGYGRLAPCYIGRFDQVILFDGSMSLLRHAYESVGHRAIIVAGDVLRLPFKAASFDSILSIRVLQHMHDLESAVKGMGRILARDGHLLFSYHNKRNAHRILNYANSRRISDPFSLESAEVSPTLLSHHPQRMSSALNDAHLSAPEYQGAVVVNALARLSEALGSSVPSGLRWASFTGKHQLAPWLIGKSYASGGDSLLRAGSIDDLFECPSCHGDLARMGMSFECIECSINYPVRGGILDFRL